MIQKSGRRGNIEIIFPVVLFLVFTLSALFIILFAARTYQHIIEGSSIQYDESTSMAYISQKLHSSDSESSIAIGNLDGNTALILTEEIDGIQFVTYIYVYDGHLRELFTAADAEGISPLSGTPLFEAGSFDASFINDGLISLTLTTAGGTETTQLVSIRSME